MWPWRDWVVSAFNRDFRMTIHALATGGDRFPRRPGAKAGYWLLPQPHDQRQGAHRRGDRIDYVLEMTVNYRHRLARPDLHCAAATTQQFRRPEEAGLLQPVRVFNQTPVDGGGGIRNRAGDGRPDGQMTEHSPCWNRTSPLRARI